MMFRCSSFNVDFAVSFAFTTKICFDMEQRIPSVGQTKFFYLQISMGLIHTAAILSREAEVALASLPNFSLRGRGW